MAATIMLGGSSRKFLGGSVQDEGGVKSERASDLIFDLLCSSVDRERRCSKGDEGVDKEDEVG